MFTLILMVNAILFALTMLSLAFVFVKKGELLSKDYIYIGILCVLAIYGFIVYTMLPNNYVELRGLCASLNLISVFGSYQSRRLYLTKGLQLFLAMGLIGNLIMYFM